MPFFISNRRWAEPTLGARNKTPGVLSVQFSRKEQLITSGRDNTARIWGADGNQISKLEGFTDLPSRATFSHDGERAIVGDFTGKVRCWSLKDKHLVGELTTNPD
mgnify:CR=1 FL=1